MLITKQNELQERKQSREIGFLGLYMSSTTNQELPLFPLSTNSSFP